MGIQLVTFGGLRVSDGELELESVLVQRSRAALFVYLAIERRASREVLAALLWPESRAENARHALRQSLYHLRKAMGDRDWYEARGHELSARDDVAADAAAFDDAVARADVERAMRLYRGPFLHGAHLVDLKGWESWVDGRRARYARLFRKVCREVLDHRIRTRDHLGAIDVAERWTSLDPTDDEAQHHLISTLAAAGEHTEAIRQYETYVRLLAPEGLEPLDQTRVVVEQLRSQRGSHRHPRPYLATRDLTSPASRAS